MQLDFGMMTKYMPYFFRSLGVTLQLTAASLLLGIVISIPLSLIKLSRYRAVRAIGTFYTSIFSFVPRRSKASCRVWSTNLSVC